MTIQLTRIAPATAGIVHLGHQRVNGGRVVERQTDIIKRLIRHCSHRTGENRSARSGGTRRHSNLYARWQHFAPPKP